MAADSTKAGATPQAFSESVTPVVTPTPLSFAGLFLSL